MQNSHSIPAVFSHAALIPSPAALAVLGVFLGVPAPVALEADAGGFSLNGTATNNLT